jgi:Holliday junction DNA helicase RuvB
LDDYKDRELVEIAGSVATELEMLVSPQALSLIARAAQGRPRRANHILRGLRRRFYAAIAEKSQLSNADVRKYLAEAGMDAQGLDDPQQKYLRWLRKLDRASLNTLASLLGSDAEQVRDEVEVGLIKLGFVRIAQDGRTLTDAGNAWVEADLARREALRLKRRDKEEVGGENN